MPRCGRHLVIEPLEQRQLLSIDMVIPGVQNGTPDEFLLVRNGTYLEAWRNGSLYDSQLFADVRSVTVNGTSDNDKLTLDLGQGDVVPDEAGIQFNADGQSSADSLVVENGSVSEATVTFTGTGAGNLALNGTTTFSGVEPISVDPDTLGSLTIQYTDSAETLYLRDDAGSVADLSRVGPAGGGSGEVTFRNPSDSLTIRAGVGNDTFTAYAPDSGFDADISVEGEAGDDSALIYDLGANYQGAVTFSGSSGDNDVAQLYGSTGNDTATSGPSSTTINLRGGVGGGGCSATSSQVKTVYVYASGGTDSITYQGSSGDNSFYATSYTAMQGTDFLNRGYDFEQITAEANQGGYDSAYLYDGTGNDTFTAYPTTATLQGSRPTVTVNDFDRVFVYATNGGNVDTAQLYGSTGNDTFQSSRTTITTTSMWVTGCYYYTSTFDEVSATVVDGGTDTATLNGGTGNDAFAATDADGTLTYAGGPNFAKAAGFDTVTANGSTGDTATFTGTSANETFTGGASSSSMAIAGTSYVAAGFPSVTANAGTGTDTATLNGGSGNDAFAATDADGTLTFAGGPNFVKAIAFDTVTANGSTGDSATFTGTSANETFTGGASSSSMAIAGTSYVAAGFPSVTANAGTGTDTATLNGGSGNDAFAATDADGTLTYAGGPNFVKAVAFDTVTANGSTGDSATFTGTSADERFDGYANSSSMAIAGTSYVAADFPSVTANAGTGIDNAYLYDNSGDNTFEAYPATASLTGAGLSLTATGFFRVMAYASNGGEDTAFFYDSADNDLFSCGDQFSSLESLNPNYHLYRSASYFDHVHAYADNETGDTDGAVLWGTTGDDELTGEVDYATLWFGGQGADHSGTAHAFDGVSAYSQGGSDDESVDWDSLIFTLYLFGTWT